MPLNVPSTNFYMLVSPHVHSSFVSITINLKLTLAHILVNLSNIFSTLDCNFDKDLKIRILQHGLPNNKDACEAEEDKWIIKLDTKSPNGMNTVLHDFGQFYKILF